MPETETLTEMLIRHEGLRLKPYYCPSGKLTIGVGRNLDDVGISSSEAMAMLGTDVARCLRGVLSELPWAYRLDSARLNALVMMAFNLGVSGLLGFGHMLDAVERGNYLQAANHMMDSRWAKQVGHRAVELAEIMRTGKGVR